MLTNKNGIQRLIRNSLLQFEIKLAASSSIGEGDMNMV